MIYIRPTKTPLNTIIEELDTHAKKMGVANIIDLDVELQGLPHWEAFKEAYPITSEVWEYVVPSKVPNLYFVVVSKDGMLHLHQVSKTSIGVSEVSASKRHWVWMRNEQYRRAYDA